MRTNILIAADGTILNPQQNQLINVAPNSGAAGSSLFINQVTLEFYDTVEQLSNGLYIPTGNAIVAGLSGTLQVKVFASPNSPYPTDLSPVDTIDISSGNTLTWEGISYALDLTATAITGCNYINVLIDRN